MLDCSCNAHQIICDSCYIVCTSCGLTQYDPHVSYSPCIKTKTLYSRSNYLKQVLQEVCGEVNAPIDEELSNQLITELRLYWTLLDIPPNYSILKLILKKHKLRKYYGAIPYLLNQWFNITPVELTVLQRHYIMKTFKKVEHRFNQTKGSRHNFFSYHLFLSIMFSKLNIDCDWIPNKPVDKRERTRQQELLTSLIDQFTSSLS